MKKDLLLDYSLKTNYKKGLDYLGYEEKKEERIKEEIIEEDSLKDIVFFIIDCTILAILFFIVAFMFLAY